MMGLYRPTYVGLLYIITGKNNSSIQLNSLGDVNVNVVVNIFSQASQSMQGARLFIEIVVPSLLYGKTLLENP